jgi:hypothetical protein
MTNMLNQQKHGHLSLRNFITDVQSAPPQTHELTVTKHTVFRYRRAVHVQIIVV